MVIRFRGDWNSLTLLWHRNRLLTSDGWFRDKRAGWLPLGPFDLLLGLSTKDRIASGVDSVLLMVMDTLHMVKQVVSPWKAVAQYSTVTAGIKACKWLVTMPMHSMCFSFMAEQTRRRGELLLGARLVFAAKRFHMRVDVFTT